MNNENMNVNGLNQNMNQGFMQPNMNQPQPGMNTGVQMQNLQSVTQSSFVQNPQPSIAQNPQNVQSVNNVNLNSQVIDPNINVGQNIDPENIKVQPNNINSEQQQQYGFKSDESKASLNNENNSNLKFVIILAILMLAFIIMLPYLSNLL